MKIQDAVEKAKECLKNYEEYACVTVPKEVLEELVAATKYHPSIRYVPCDEGNAKIHTLAGGQKVIVNERERG